jgi:hypothetical protein
VKKLMSLIPANQDNSSSSRVAVLSQYRAQCSAIEAEKGCDKCTIQTVVASQGQIKCIFNFI